MSKGTPSFGKRQTKTHIRCRRCGHVAFHPNKKHCVHCGFGKSRKLKHGPTGTRLTR